MSGNFEIRRRPLEEGDGEMSASAERSEGTNPKTGMTHAEMKEFIRNHFEEFVLRNRDLADRQPADRGALGLPGEFPPGAWLELQT